MKNFKILLFFIILLAVCFTSVLLFTLPAFIQKFNLTSTSNIGSTIGGITAPVIGIITALLLYFTLSKQIDANEKARLKNESDIIFLLFNQLDSEYDKFYYKYSQTVKGEKQQFKFTGIEGINEFTNDFAFEWTIKEFDYADIYQAKQLSLLLNSYKLIDRRIEISQLDETLKELFYQKLEVLYNCKFREPVKAISDKCKELQKSDNLTRELDTFHSYYSGKFADDNLNKI